MYKNLLTISIPLTESEVGYLNCGQSLGLSTAIG